MHFPTQNTPKKRDILGEKRDGAKKSLSLRQIAVLLTPMKFNAKKCYLMNITRTRNHLTHNYSLNNHTLQTVTREKYLGITISNDLNWSTHINTITNKCNSKLGFLRRNLSRCPQKLKETAYLSLVRPTLEYAASVWDPHLIKDRNSLEAVPRKAARFVYGDYRWRASPTLYVKDTRVDKLRAQTQGQQT